MFQQVRLQSQMTETIPTTKIRKVTSHQKIVVGSPTPTHHQPLRAAKLPSLLSANCSQLLALPFFAPIDNVMVTSPTKPSTPSHVGDVLKDPFLLNGNILILTIMTK